MRHKKKFGQHFLHEKSILDKIIDASALSSKDNVLEIGPGQGALTDRLLPLVNSLIAIEIDSDLVPFLDHKYLNQPKFSLLHSDALKVDFSALNGAPFKLVSNLPYQITSPLLYRLFEDESIFEVVLMLQHDIVERMLSSHGSKVYGGLSILCQYYFELNKVCRVAKGCFTPPPKVESAVVKLVRRPLRHDKVIRLWLGMLVKKAFLQRRKTINNTLKPWLKVDEFGLDGSMRPEELSVDDFISLAINSVSVGKSIINGLERQ